MGKTVSGGAIAQLNRQTGSEPFIVVGINWGAGTTWYSSRTIPGYNPNITDIGQITSSKRQDTMCSSSSVSLTFSDTDGSMKYIIDNRNAEKAPAVAYLAFAGTSPYDFIELIRGKTVGPVEWDEGNRKLTLSIESHTESEEIGYSATQEDFNDLMEGAEGIPWPIIFGACAHVPALQVREHTAGHLKYPIKLFQVPSWRQIPGTKICTLNIDPDVYSLNDEPPTKNKIFVEGGSKFPQNRQIRIEIQDCIFRGVMRGDIFHVTEGNVPRYQDIKIGPRLPDHEDIEVTASPFKEGKPRVGNPRAAWIKEILFEGEMIVPSLVNHHVYFKVPGTEYPGTWYNFVVKQVGKKIWFRYPVIHPNTREEYLLGPTDTIETAYTVTVNGMSVDVAGDVERLTRANAGRRGVPDKPGIARIAWMMDEYEKQNNSWWQCPSEVEVHLWGLEDPDVYIASLVKLSNVKAVFGKRRVTLPDGKTKEIIEQLPKTYYKIQLESNYAVRGQIATGIIFHRALTSYAGQDWTGDIFVTGTSTVGPNSCDIIKWIFQQWTSLTPDSSFGSVRDKVAGMEAHFAMFDKRDALRFASEIAFQARCGLVLDSERVGIRFLAEQPVTLNILNESNTELDTLSRSFTPTTEITTRLISSWSETYREKSRLAEIFQKNISKTERVIRSLVPSNRRSKTETRYSVYEENMAHYGVRGRDESAYIYVKQADVDLFQEFWGHRFANSWQLVSLRTTLMGTILQVFDGITLEFTDTTLLNASLLIGQIEEVSINPQDWSVSLLIWLPRIAGSNFVDSRAWPES